VINSRHGSHPPAPFAGGWFFLYVPPFVVEPRPATHFPRKIFKDSDGIRRRFALMSDKGEPVFQNLAQSRRREMGTTKISFRICTLILLVSAAMNAQQTATSSTATVVPRLVNFAGRATNAQGGPVTGIAGITFAIYKDQYEGAPLWMETQNVTADAKGSYTVQLGATKAEGLPLDLFTSGEARWLGVRVNGGEEQPRVLLLSVPYALKAADAETVGGLPASAFLLATAQGAASTSINAITNAGANSITPALAGTGTTDFLPLWTNSTGTLGNSVLFQSGTGTTAKVGINSTTPASTLDVNGAVTARGNLSLPATGAATTTAGKNSQPLSFTASSYNSGTGAAVNQNFRWQAEPAGNDTASASGTLNLLYSVGANTPAETGLKITKNGLITFASGQTYPGTSTITDVIAGTDLTGGGTSGKVTLNVNTSALNSTYARLTAPNTFTANQTVNGNLSATTTTPGATTLSATSTNGEAVAGVDTTEGYGVFGQSDTGFGVYGGSNAFPGVAGGSANNPGVSGFSANAQGVQGMSLSTIGVEGDSSSTSSYGVYGSNTASGGGYGVYGTGYDGVVGNGSNFGVAGLSSSSGAGVYAYNNSSGDALFAQNLSGGYAAFLEGPVDVDGTFTNAVGLTKMDDPIDPANKYLYHSSVESPDMMNIYNGTVTTDAEGNATVQMPDWFEALNRDFRYQLTAIGQAAQAYISSELNNRQFSIKTDKPNVKISWQVTGVRQDAWANAHRIPAEVEKPANERGYYMHPELFGASADRSIAAHRHPGMLKPPAQLSQKTKAQAQLSHLTQLHAAKH
jgi:trimeric autotransporter adhesin